MERLYQTRTTGTRHLQQKTDESDRSLKQLQALRRQNREDEQLPPKKPLFRGISYELMDAQEAGTVAQAKSPDHFQNREEEKLVLKKPLFRGISYELMAAQEAETMVQAKKAIGSESEEIIQEKAEETPNQTGLPDNLKAGVENLSGYSLDNVRVHYNSPKPSQLQALAYTQGTDIHVAPGEEEHLPHEAWHVVQQMQGRVKSTMQMKGVQINDDEGLEKESDVMGANALSLLDDMRTSPQPILKDMPTERPVIQDAFDAITNAPFSLIKPTESGKDSEVIQRRLKEEEIKEGTFVVYDDMVTRKYYINKCDKTGKKVTLFRVRHKGDKLIFDGEPLIITFDQLKQNYSVSSDKQYSVSSDKQEDEWEAKLWGLVGNVADIFREKVEGGLKEIAGIKTSAQSKESSASLDNIINKFDKLARQNPNLIPRSNSAVYRVASFSIIPATKGWTLVQINPWKDRDFGTLDMGGMCGGDLQKVVYELMVNNGQGDYILGLMKREPDEGWKYRVDVDFYYNRLLSQAAWHKDTTGATMFVNLVYNNKEKIEGPETLFSPSLNRFARQHDPQSYPPEFMNDVKLIEEGDIGLRLNRGNNEQEKKQIGGATLGKYGTVSFVDPLYFHSTPYLKSRNQDPQKYKYTYLYNSYEWNGMYGLTEYGSHKPFGDTGDKVTGTRFDEKLGKRERRMSAILKEQQRRPTGQEESGSIARTKKERRTFLRTNIIAYKP